MWGFAVMSKEYETELEKTIEHLHKVIEEKTTIIDQQKELLDKFMKGEIVVSSQDAGYTTVPSYQAAAYTGNGIPTGPLTGYNTSSNSSSSSDDVDNTLPQGGYIINAYRIRAAAIRYNRETTKVS
jgi:hypothetical protein